MPNLPNLNSKIPTPRLIKFTRAFYSIIDSETSKRKNTENTQIDRLGL
jgi:hypothetical protein